jgi:hypothetical protein
LRTVVISHAAGLAGVPSPGQRAAAIAKASWAASLAEVEVAEEADQRGEDTPPLLAEDLLQNLHR